MFSCHEIGYEKPSDAILLFRVDAGPIDHLAQHDVTPEEFEEIVSNPDYEDISRSTGNPVAFGLTSTGRYLCCVFKRFGDDVIEPVTSYEVGE